MVKSAAHRPCTPNPAAQCSIVQSLPNIEVLSLSNNCIGSLAPFGGCSKLRELYLRGNRVCALEELQHLAGLQQLRLLWLTRNPIAELPGYRAAVLRALPQLEKLDDMVVTEQEVAEAAAQAPAAEEEEERSEESAPPTPAAAALAAITHLLPLLGAAEMQQLRNDLHSQ